jgi:hypothetical protein
MRNKSNRPPDLEFPCCNGPKWREAEYKVDPDKSKLMWRSMDFYVSACKYDPRYTSPDLEKECPYRKLFGKSIPLIVVSCDFCNAVIGKFMATTELVDLTIEELMNMPQVPPPDIDEGEGLYICNKCLDLPHNAALKAKILKNNPSRFRR